MNPVSKYTFYIITMSSSDDTSSAAAPLTPLGTESRTSFIFKLDHIKRVDSTTNYLSCRNQVSIDLQVMDIYKWLDVSTTKLTDTTHLSTWTCNNYIAQAAIMTLQPKDFICLARDALRAKEVLTAVEDNCALRDS